MQSSVGGTQRYFQYANLSYHDCERGCLEPCEHVTYVAATRREEETDATVTTHISYSSLSYTTVTERYATEFSNLIASVGGIGECDFSTNRLISVYTSQKHYRITESSK